MKTSTFYRVEHKEIKHQAAYAGPYGMSDSPIEIDVEDWADEDTEGHTDDKHPEPMGDNPIFKGLNRRHNWQKKFCFGFTDLKQLKQWFSKKELRRLQEFGFVISVYESSNYVVSAKQAAFLPKGERKIIAIK